METRFQNDNIECRQEEGKEKIISGYAIVFNSPSVDLGGFIEVIDKRALDGVDLSDTYFYSQHKSSDILGNTKSGTLSLRLTDKGLYFTAKLPNTQLGNDTYELIKRGDLKSLSFGFLVGKDSWDVTKNPQVRTVTKISSLEEISVVSRPAYTDTMVSTRAKNMVDSCSNISKCNNINKKNMSLETAKLLLESVS